MIRHSKPIFFTSPYKYLEGAFASGWLGTGPLVAQFEERLCKLIGCKYFIATTSGTTALHLAYDVLDLADQEVVLPSLTYAATLQPLLALGATPVFCDVDDSNCNAGLKEIKDAVTSQTAAIVLVHYSGNPTNDLAEILEFAAKRGIKVIQDAAHCIGVTYQGKHIGADSLACFSFGPVKQITSGSGGGIATNSDELNQQLRIKRNLGINTETWKRKGTYSVTTIGYRHAMTDTQAAVGLAQLDDIDTILKKRWEIIIYYDRHLQQNHYRIPSRREETHSLYLYPIILNQGIDRRMFLDHLRNKGVEAGIHYQALHQQPVILTDSKLPNTEYLSRQLVTLPLHCGLAAEDLQQIIKAVDA